jgi:hypothetical protein
MELYGVATFGELSSLQKRQVLRDCVRKIGPTIAARIEPVTGMVIIKYVECNDTCPVDRTVTCDDHREGDVNGNVHGTTSGMRWGDRDPGRFCIACGADLVGNDPHAPFCPKENA